MLTAYPHSVKEALLYLHGHHGNLVVVGLSLRIRCCCRLSADWLTYDFLGRFRILGRFPLCSHTQKL